MGNQNGKSDRIRKLAKEKECTIFDLKNSELYKLFEAKTVPEKSNIRVLFCKLKKRESRKVKKKSQGNKVSLIGVLSEDEIMDEVDDVKKLKEGIKELEKLNGAIKDDDFRRSLEISDKRWRIIRGKDEFKQFQFKPRNSSLFWASESLAEKSRRKIDLLD